jgi:SAM-dependent methyltransferase
MAASRSDEGSGDLRRDPDRLTRQTSLFEPLTRQFLHEAGLRPGMRVLDVGSGVGDVAFVAAEMVRPDGSVLGIDRAPEAVAKARARAQGRRLHHVNFIEGDLATLDLGQTFDAIVGRFVLMYCPDPVAALRRLAVHLSPGGIVAFQEYDVAAAQSLSQPDLLARAFEGADARMGSKLHATFLAAGLAAPNLRLAATGPRMLAEALETLSPAARLRAEACALDGAIVAPELVGAWSASP